LVTGEYEYGKIKSDGPMGKMNTKNSFEQKLDYTPLHLKREIPERKNI